MVGLDDRRDLVNGAGNLKKDVLSETAGNRPFTFAMAETDTFERWRQPNLHQRWAYLQTKDTVRGNLALARWLTRYEARTKY